MTLTSFLEGPMAKIVAYTSGAFMSCVIGPPEGPMVLGSWRVRSGPIRAQLWPASVVFQRCCELVNSRRGLTGEKMIGYVHCHRSTSALDGSPENMRGYGLTSRDRPVRRSRRSMKPPLLEPEKKMSGSRGSGAT